MGWGNQFSWIFSLLAVFQPGMFLDAVCISALQKPFARIMERMEQHGQVRHVLKWVLLLESCQGMDEESLYLSGWCLGICEIQICHFRSDTSSTDMHCSFFKSQTLWSVKWLESSIFVQFFSWSFLKKFCWVLHSCFCLTVKKGLVFIEVYSEMTYSVSHDSWLYLSFALFPAVWSSGRILQHPIPWSFHIYNNFISWPNAFPKVQQALKNNMIKICVTSVSI